MRDPPDAARILDVGSGTGEYIRAWEALGAKDVTGMDITEAAVNRLKEVFPGRSLVRGDITHDVPHFPLASFDVISCMDVLFHVTEDARYDAALLHVGRLLKPGGMLVWSDFFVHGRETTGGHIVWRKLQRAESAVAAGDMEVVLREPLFWLMNEPRDTRVPGALPAWKAAMWLASRNERVADVAGSLCGVWIDGWRLGVRESPSTEIMVCRRRGVESV